MRHAPERLPGAGVKALRLPFAHRDRLLSVIIGAGPLLGGITSERGYRRFDARGSRSFIAVTGSNTASIAATASAA
jgi:hypothetical protein